VGLTAVSVAGFFWAMLLMTIGGLQRAVARGGHSEATVLGCVRPARRIKSSELIQIRGHFARDGGRG
jgi:hypothetical protein